MRLIFLPLLLTMLSSLKNESSAQIKEMTDKATENMNDLWLEEVEGEKALAWVRGQNERSLADLTADPRYAVNESEAIDIFTSKERIPYGRIRGGMVYNFWQDDVNVRGIWRRTPVAEYAKEKPEWETVLDFDKLTKDEGKNWVFKGSNVFKPKGGDRYVCLVSLSDGGKDAVVLREFDLLTKTFVKGGFETPEAKQRALWVDADTLLIGTDWGNDSLTESGYPRIVKRWKRGTSLSEAVEVIRGDKSDVGVWPMTLEMEDGTILQNVTEVETFFTSTYWLLSEDEEPPIKWPLPEKCWIVGIYKDQLLVILRQDWSVEEENGSEVHPSGDLVAFSIDEFLKTKKLPKVKRVFHANEKQAIKNVSIAKGAVLLTLNENVSGKLLRLDLTENGDWLVDPIDLPGTGEVGVTYADTEETTVHLSYDGFLTPDSLLKYDVLTGKTEPLKNVQAKFNAEGLVVEQFFATSTDGTKIPYYVVRRKDVELNGKTPTLLYAYGGFQISLGPGYRPTIGKLWLEKGGAYVLANIRGGGEFGPKWHQAGLKMNRQKVYDDFISVGEDLIKSGLTSPNHLGIMGGSNGGLLMGVMLNQRPDLWSAVVVQVPLLDMLRYHLLLAGASWVDEYGSPDVPDERAFLEKISPVHNFDSKKEYPVPFFVTSTKDDRVHPAHARKMAKKFQDAKLPFFYYENIDGGHSAAANQTERAKRSALEFTYLAQRLFPEGGK